MVPETEIHQFFLLMYLDTKNLFDRMRDRKNDYIRSLSLKRNRKPLQEVFKTKYFTANVENLKKYPLSIIQSLDEFHKLADDLNWYLNNTEDMTQAITDRVDTYILHIERVYVPLIDEMELFNRQFIKTEEPEALEVPELPKIPIIE